MTRLELRVLIAATLAATVVLGAVMCAAYGQAAIAAALAIYALGVGAWLYHAIERLVLARRIETVRAAATPFRPLLPVMAAIMALTKPSCGRCPTPPRLRRHGAGSRSPAVENPRTTSRPEPPLL
jgi:hypothetical protein